jgi:polygalacturonase
MRLRLQYSWFINRPGTLIPGTLILSTFILGTLILGTLSAVAPAWGQTSPTETMGWEVYPIVLQHISTPSFPDREFNVKSYGAKEGGEFNCTHAFAAAIDACTRAGGGKVVVPAGTYLTGPIVLKNNVNLVVSKGATLRFSTNPKHYLPAVYTRWEGVECMNYSPLIYAYGQKNIAVTGEGVLDGQGSPEHWWSWSGKPQFNWKEGMPLQKPARTKLLAMADSMVPVQKRIMGEGSYLRPNFFQPYKCANVLVEGVTFLNSPMWFLHPVLSSNVSILGVTVKGLGPNNDGCDPESCTNVLIEDCIFDTGDDCIAIKSGRNTDGRRVDVATENVVVRGCTMKDGHGGVVMGSEISGSVRNVFVENCHMDSPNLDRALRFKTNSVRGGTIENVFMRNVTVGQVAEAVVKVDFYYEEGDAGQFTPALRNVQVSDVTCKKSMYGIWIRAYDRSPATDITLQNCTFENIAKPNVLENVRNLTLLNVTMNYASDSKGAGK